MADTGEWGELFDWPLIAIHAVMTQDGKLLTFGTDTSGTQGGTMYHDLWDPVTGQHHLLDHHTHTPTDIFCAAAVILPGTNKILIAGGDARPDGHTNMGVDDVNLFDADTHEMRPATDGEMNAARWYPTTISLPSGQVLILGGIDVNGVGQGTPELYTPGEGWRSLTGATDADVTAVYSYPKAWVGPTGEVFYIANGDGPDHTLELMALDVAGDGSLREVARLPFYLDWDSPAIMYDTGKILINDFDTGLWTIDITTAVPAIERVATLPQQKNFGNMTVLADGTVLFNGGTGQGNLEAYAEKTAYIWDPATGVLTVVPPEAQPRLYHSSTILLADGSVISLGGGSASTAENDYLDGQIYRPDYLFNPDGSDATRPVIVDAPSTLVPGEEFRITVDDASAIERLTFAKTGAVTHNINMDARFTTLDFHVIDATTIEVHLPHDAQAITAGSWMLFAWNTAGVPSIAPIIAVDPMLAAFDGIGDLAADYFAVPAGTTSLDQIDFAAASTDRQLVDRVDAATSGAVAARGPVAARYAGTVHVEAAGTYTFHLSTSDGARLYIDGKLVIDGNAVRSASALTATVTLASGDHQVELRWFATDGSAAVDLDWSGAGFSRRQLTFDGTVDNLLVNGGFERAGGADDWLPGWTVGGALDSRADGGERSGNAYVAIDAASGPLTQTVATVAGATYAMAVDVSGQAGVSVLEVVVNGVVLATVRPGDAAWHRYEVTFTGTGRDVVVLRAPNGSSALVDTAVLTGPSPDEPGDDHHGNHIMGTDASDRLPGTGGADHIMAMGGNDVVSGRGGDDTVDGGSGDDRLSGERGRDILIGGTGADRFVFGPGDSARGDRRDVIKDFVPGEDKIVLGDGARDFIGRNGFTRTAGEVRVGAVDGVTVVQFDRDGNGRADLEIAVTGVPSLGAGDFVGLAVLDRRLVGTTADDRLVGLDGDDTLIGLGGDDLLDGGAGVDTADYAAARAALRIDLAVLTPQVTGLGKDRLLNVENLIGGSGADALFGNAAANRLEGGGGDDDLRGRDGDDVLAGGKGNDLLNGAGGIDTADYARAPAGLRASLEDGIVAAGTFGRDTLAGIENLTGGRGDDRLDGDGGANRLAGGAGDDELFGSGGADVLMGGSGDDVLSGGSAADLLAGGSGRDTFWFNIGGSVPGARDVIADFVQGEDVITGNLVASGWIGTRGFTGVAGEVRYAIQGHATIVQLDANGDRTADLEIELAGALALRNSDFLNLPNATWSDPIEREALTDTFYLAGGRDNAPVGWDLP